MLQDALFARASLLAEGNNRDVAVRFVRASLKGWIYCRDHAADCVQYTTDAGSTLGAGHQAWMMNEVNALLWPRPDGRRPAPPPTGGIPRAAPRRPRPAHGAPGAVHASPRAMTLAVI